MYYSSIYNSLFINAYLDLYICFDQITGLSKLLIQHINLHKVPFILCQDLNTAGNFQHVLFSQIRYSFQSNHKAI